MPDYVLAESQENTVPITPVRLADFDQWLQKQDEKTRNWVAVNRFGQQPLKHLRLHDENGHMQRVIALVGDEYNPYDFSELPNKLPLGHYRLDSEDEQLAEAAVLGWGFGAYHFDRYKQKERQPATLVVPGLKDKYREAAERVAATTLVRDLINTPADDMGPSELAAVVRDMAEKHGAGFSEIIGDELLKENFPAVHLVGRASHKQPRLIQMEWGQAGDPLICLVGKGVCFDTGGINLKPATSMRHMKKDMGGAAHVLGLAQLIMNLNLPVRLQVIIPAVENAVSANAFRQGDIVTSRKGLTIEIGHTDAEGRVILADALALAAEQQPELIIDFATLTGAARVALGPELPPIFCNTDGISSEVVACSNETHDPLWPMPLYQPYNSMITRTIADLSNVGKLSMAGCITAALFLEHFVEKDIPWIHIDTFGWNNRGIPGRPIGGEAMGMSAIYQWLKKRYGASA